MFTALALLVILGLPTWLFIELAFYWCKLYEWKDRQKRNPTPQPIPADDLIGRNIRDVR